MAEEMLHAKRMKVKLSIGWWKLFRKRHPSLTQRKADMLCKPRMGATSRKVLDRYFDFLEEVLVHNGLVEKPAQIFNCDETGISLQHSTGQVVVPTSQKRPFSISSATKKQITVIACTSAAGYALPPFVVSDRKTLNKLS